MSSEVKPEAIQLPNPPLAEEWAGKTVERAIWHEDLLIRFTDGSCCRLVPNYNYGEGIYLEVEKLKDYHLRQLGYMTDEEYDAYEKQQNKEREAEFQEDRRHLYEQLRKEFGEEK